MSEPTTATNSKRRLLGAGILLIIMITLVWTLPIEEWLTAAQVWSERHPWQGRVGYVVAFIIGACIMVPGSLLFMSGGYLFGFVWGGVLAAVATPLAASAAFYVGATVARKQVAQLVADNPRFNAIDRAIDEKGWLIVLLTRLSMVLPYNVLNYAYSVTRVRQGDYFSATALGMLPPVLLFVYIGAAANNIDALTNSSGLPEPWGKVVLFAGVGLLAAAMFIIQRTATRILKQSIESTDQ